MGIINPFKKEFDQKTVKYELAGAKNLLLIFTRNPELGKGKRRLAATVGDEIAFEIYKFLLDHTVAITKDLTVEKQVWYSEKMTENDRWDNEIYTKKVQQGEDLGIRMAHAFTEGFADGFEKICIIGSDLYDLDQATLEAAFLALNSADYVVGPAEDGGYYLLGMTRSTPVLFKEKVWGEPTVLADTLSDLKNEKVHLLPVRNDVDTYDDIKDVPVFHPFIKQLKK